MCDEFEGYDPSDDEGDLLREIDRLMERFGMTYEEARYRLGFDIRRGETST